MGGGEQEARPDVVWCLCTLGRMGALSQWRHSRPSQDSGGRAKRQPRRASRGCLPGPRSGLRRVDADKAHPVGPPATAMRCLHTSSRQPSWLAQPHSFLRGLPLPTLEPWDLGLPSWQGLDWGHFCVAILCPAGLPRARLSRVSCPRSPGSVRVWRPTRASAWPMCPSATGASTSVEPPIS